jgi:hypothetical protein
MGTNIILPDAITTIAGLDFDIDKCYVMAQEFTFNKEKGQFIVTKPPSRKDINAEPKEGEMNILGLADPQYMSKAERHNLLFSVMRATLRNSEVSETQFTPGNFDELKKTGKIVEALNNPDVNLSYDELSKLSISDLRRLNDNKSDIFSPKSQVQLFRRNNVAAGLIGIVALNEVNNIYRQSTEAKLAKPITINNRSLSKLNNVKINGRYLSSVFSQYAAATVDAVKDPILDSMNMNMNTINAAMLLTSLGFTIEETGLFMSQPAIVELSRIFTLNPYTNAGVELKKMLKEKTNQMASLEHEGSDTRPDEELTVRNLAYRISDSAKGMSNVPFDIAVIKTAIQLFDDAKEMSDFVGASRADSSNTKIGPSIADTSALELKILTHNVNQEKTNTKGEPVSKIRNLPKISLDTSYLKDHAALRKEFRENGFIQAFTTCGIAGNVNMMDSMFPHHRYFGILSEIQSNVSKNGRLTVKQVNSIFNDIFVFEMSQYDRFSHTKHQAYNKEFPVQFALFKEKYKEQLKDIKFIQNIKFYPGTPTNYPYLKFVTRGKVNSETRESFIRE